jgi:hypothetical protein
VFVLWHVCTKLYLFTSQFLQENNHLSMVQCYWDHNCTTHFVVMESLSTKLCRLTIMSWSLGVLWALDGYQTSLTCSKFSSRGDRSFQLVIAFGVLLAWIPLMEPLNSWWGSHGMLWAGACVLMNRLHSLPGCQVILALAYHVKYLYRIVLPSCALKEQEAPAPLTISLLYYIGKNTQSQQSLAIL